MAQTFSTGLFPDIIRFACSATPGNLTEVVIPEGTTVVTVLFDTDDGYVATTGTDGAAIGSDYFPIVGGGYLELSRANTTPSHSRSISSLYVASTAVSGTCSVVVEGK